MVGAGWDSGPVPSPAAAPQHSERLGVPLRWWVQATMLLAAVWLAVVVAMPAVAAAVVTLVVAVLVVGGLLWWGSARVVVADDHLCVGRARVPLDVLGEVRALDAEATRLTAGRDADVRAHLALRPWVKESVRVQIEDPRDPTPYWLVSTRRPDRLVAALTGGTPPARTHGDPARG